MAENSYDLVVLGSGTGGYSTAIRAAGLGLLCGYVAVLLGLAAFLLGRRDA